MKHLSTLFFAAFLTNLYGSIPVVFESSPTPPKQFHNAEYKAGWDIDFSPYAGGENLLFATRLIERAEGYIIGKSPVSYSKQASARLWRMSELLFGWLPVNYFAMVVQHEVFGHGYRIRDINNGKVKVTGYSFGTPLPYGSGGGSTSYTLSSSYTTTDESAVSMAGVESTAILAQLTKLKWLEANWVDPRQSLLYLLSQYDLTLYIGSLKGAESLDGHDIQAYVHAVNYTYPASLLTNSELRDLSWINLIDPFTYYALFSWFHYISSGKETKIPMIPAWGWGYLPGARMGLTPFGPEFFIEHYLLQDATPVYFYMKGGKHANNNYYGLGFYAPKIRNIGRWSIGARFDGWKQPRLLLQPAETSILDIDFHIKPDPDNPLYPYSKQYETRYGAAGSLIAAYHGNRSGGEIELGYKAQGFLPGYSLYASPVTRLYYSLFF